MTYTLKMKTDFIPITLTTSKKNVLTANEFNNMDCETQLRHLRKWRLSIRSERMPIKDVPYHSFKNYLSYLLVNTIDRYLQIDKEYHEEVSYLNQAGRFIKAVDEMWEEFKLTQDENLTIQFPPATISVNNFENYEQVKLKDTVLGFVTLEFNPAHDYGQELRREAEINFNDFLQATEFYECFEFIFLRIKALDTTVKFEPFT